MLKQMTVHSMQSILDADKVVSIIIIIMMNILGT